MESTNSSGRESPFEVVTPPTATKKARPAKATPKAVGEDGEENAAGGNFSATEVKLLIEMLSTLGERSNGIKFNWAAISEKLELPSAGATAKRAERLLKRFDLKMSDITGGRNARTPKTADEAATPRSKRKSASDGLETPTKRRGGAKAGAKKEDTQGGSGGAGNGTSRIEVLIKPKKGAKKEANGAADDVFGI